MVGGCVGICMCSWLFVHLKKKCRTKYDVARHVAVALARINNSDCKRTKKAKVKMGVGSDAANVEEWLEDIFYTYDVDRENSIDREAFQKFVDHTLKVA